MPEPPFAYRDNDLVYDARVDDTDGTRITITASPTFDPGDYPDPDPDPIRRAVVVLVNTVLHEAGINT